MSHVCIRYVAHWTLVLLFSLAVPTGFAAEPSRPALVVGLVPNVSARTLLSAFQPMRSFLERVLKEPVHIYTAPDFHTFYEETQHGDFDLVVTPAHFAWLATREAGYVPLVTYQNPLRGLIVVRHDSAIDSAQALRGKKVGIVDPLAIVTMRGIQWFQEQGLQADKDFFLYKSAPHNTAALAVGRGELDAAIIGSGPYRIMPEDIRLQVRVLSEVGSVPNAVYLARGDMPEEKRRALKAALLAFGNDSPEGRHFMEQYSYGGFKSIGAPELKPMEAYAQRVKALLALP